MTRFLFCTACTILLTLRPALPVPQTQTISVPHKNPALAEKIQLAGVNNAGKINDHLFRGAQPNTEGVQSLRKLGVTTVIALRGEDRGRTDSEKTQTEGLGMKFLLIPEGNWSSPADEQIAEFFRTLTQRPQQTIFVHCHYGEDRTGVFIAAYRMTFEHWTPQQALAEMHEFHFNSFWHPNLESYVKHFPQRLAQSPTLAPYRLAPASAAAASTSAH